MRCVYLNAFTGGCWHGNFDVYDFGNRPSLPFVFRNLYEKCPIIKRIAAASALQANVVGRSQDYVSDVTFCIDNFLRRAFFAIAANLSSKVVSISSK